MKKASLFAWVSIIMFIVSMFSGCAVKPDITNDNPSQSINDYSIAPFNYEEITILHVGDGYNDADDIKYSLDKTIRDGLFPLFRFESWTPATDLPSMGFIPDFYITQGEQIWFFNQYLDDNDEQKILVIPSFSDENENKVCYFAPFDIREDILNYVDSLTPMEQH